MNVLVIGGSGFLGSHIADALSAGNHTVTIFDIKSSAWASNSQTVVVGDISDQALLEREIRKSDVVYHMAGIADIAEAEADPLLTISDNIMGSAKVISLCAKHSVRLMYGSTIYVYSKHGSFYRASKQAVETLIEVFHEKNGLQYTILRFGSLYGPRAQSWNGLRRIVSEMINNKKIEFGGTGGEKREYINVVDAARMSVDLLGAEYLSKAITLTGIQVLTQAELLEMIKEILGTDVSVTFNPESTSHAHYKLTPYQYVPKSSTKHISSEYVDIGQGILELISELSDVPEI
jgi:UDP-glucose 4-epimerase